MQIHTEMRHISSMGHSGAFCNSRTREAKMESQEFKPVWATWRGEGHPGYPVRSCLKKQKEKQNAYIHSLLSKYLLQYNNYTVLEEYSCCWKLSISLTHCLGKKKKRKPEELNEVIKI